MEEALSESECNYRLQASLFKYEILRNANVILREQPKKWSSVFQVAPFAVRV